MPLVKVRKRPDRNHLQLYYTDHITGKIRTKSAGTADWDDAQRAAQRWEDEVLSLGNPAATSWEVFRVRYEDEHTANLSAGSQASITAALNHFESIIGKPRRIELIDTSTISRFSSVLRTRLDSEPTLSTYLARLRAALNWAARMGMIARVPHFTMPRQSDTLARGRPLTDREFTILKWNARIIRPRDYRQWCRFLTGLWLSGLRLSEAIRLTWDASDFAVDLSGQYPRFRIRAAGQKRRKDQLLSITPDFAAWLLKTTPDTYRTGRVFKLLKPGGKLITSPKAISRTISDIGESAGIITDPETNQHATAHDLRRSFGQRWAKVLRPVELRQLMRHKSISTTLKYYVAEDVEDLDSRLWESDSARQ